MSLTDEQLQYFIDRDLLCTRPNVIIEGRNAYQVRANKYLKQKLLTALFNKYDEV